LKRPTQKISLEKTRKSEQVRLPPKYLTPGRGRKIVGYRARKGRAKKPTSKKAPPLTQSGDWGNKGEKKPPRKKELWSKI